MSDPTGEVNSLNGSGGDSPQLLSPQQAARFLGVSSSGLRRIAEIYASVRGRLPRDPATRRRMWPPETLEELGRARRMVQGGVATSIREALLQLERGGVADDWQSPGLPSGATQSPTIWDAGNQRAIRDLRDELLQELSMLRDEISQLRSELATLASSSAAVGGSERKELLELRRRLSYLQAELEARDA